MKVTLHIWRQSQRSSKENFAQDGKMARYELPDVSPDMSFLEMLDVLNEQLIKNGEQPVAFDHDCREGICGSCGVVIDGVPHGPERGTTTCQLHMRSFRDGAEIYVEPWRAGAFPVVRDLVVDRSAFDRVVQSGAYISVNTGAPQDANAVPVNKADADRAFDAATASAAARAWQPARTRRPCCSSAPRCRTLRTCRRGGSSARVARAIWSLQWIARGSATAPISMNAKPCARRKSRCG